MALASLPMYDLPELRGATDAWWAGLARAFRAEGINDVPKKLTRAADHEALWRDPGLLFSQTCGYPLTHAFKDALAPLATPVYRAPGCDGPTYRSLIVVRAEEPATSLVELRGRRAAINARISHSGCNALRHAVAPLADGRRFFAAVVITRSHLGSLDAVFEGRADVCAIDCVTFALLGRHRRDSTLGLRLLAETEAAPGLPFVTRADAPEDLRRRLRAGLMAALADPALAKPRELLLLAGAEVLPDDAYDRIDAMEREAEDLGYPQLA